MQQFIPQEIIRKKRDNKELSKEEIEFFVDGITHGHFMDSQISALAMAIIFNGMNEEETVHLTKAMIHSGDMLSWDHLNGPVVDKHSTGGVGDKVSLLLAPLLAACGAYVPMIVGRGLGHTGGTVDKLESIPGYNVYADNDLFQKTVEKLGCAIISQTEKLAPADKRFYSIRDITATVEKVELITASILAKKIASGAKTLVMDVKVGNAAFADSLAFGQSLAKSLVKVGNGAGSKTTALLTDMNQILGFNAGNAVEVQETIDVFRDGKGNERLMQVTFALAAEILYSSGISSTQEEAEQKVQSVWESGRPAELFDQMVFEFGGPTSLIENASKHLPQAEIVKPIYAKQPGYIHKIDTRQIGLSLIQLGGGRLKNTDKIDYAVGITGMQGLGDYVDQDTPIGFIHANSENSFDHAYNSIINCYHISDEQPTDSNPIILDRYA